MSIQATGDKQPKHAPWSDSIRVTVICVWLQDLRKIALCCSRLLGEDKANWLILKRSLKSLLVILKIVCKIFVFWSWESICLVLGEKYCEVFSKADRDLN